EPSRWRSRPRETLPAFRLLHVAFFQYSSDCFAVGSPHFSEEFMKTARALLLLNLVLCPVAVLLPRTLVSLMPEESLQQQIVGKEREELEALKAGDHKAFADLLADEAIFLDPRGHGTKAEVVEHTADFRLLDFTMENVKFVAVGANSGIIAYKLTQKGNAH